LIAAALAHGPRYLVADEPVSALDAALRGEIMALLVRLCRERGMAMLLVSHDLAGIEHHADRLLLLDSGKVAESGIRTADRHFTCHRLWQAIDGRDAAPVRAAPAELPESLARCCWRWKVPMFTFPKPGWRRGRIDAVVDAGLTLARGETLGAGRRFGFGQVHAGAGDCRIWGRWRRAQSAGKATRSRQRQRRSAEHRRLIQPVFQDPLASLDPRWSVADIILEPVKFLAIASPPKPNGMMLAELLARSRPCHAILRSANLPLFPGDRRSAWRLPERCRPIPICLLLDEATSALDPLVADGVVAYLGGCSASAGYRCCSSPTTSRSPAVPRTGLR
jgi:ABC-type glutathione transport system ATPase component